jgi:hypothetical protein
MNFARDVGWYYISATNRAAAWTSVHYLHKFLTTNKKEGPYGKEINVERVEQGDIIQLSFDGTNFTHSLLVTEIWPQILIATNSIDALDKPLNQYEYEKARGIKILGVN